MKMPKKLKAKWLKALRSGEYGQTTGKLTDGKGGFCCLGVLQHVASGGMCEISDSSSSRFRGVPSGEWYRDNKIDPIGDSILVEMNDGEVNYDAPMRKNGNYPLKNRKTFKTIAKYIEQNVETID